MIELASETDFVAKNEQFQTLAGDIVAHFAGSPATRRRRRCWPRRSRTAARSAENIDALAAVIGEKLELRRAVKLDGQVATYLHRKASDLPPQVGVLVQFTGDDVCRPPAAPPCRSPRCARATSAARRRPGRRRRQRAPRAEAKARAEGKPEAALPKIVEGRLNGFFKDNVLLEQPAVQDSKKTVKAGARRGRCDGHRVRALRGRRGLSGDRPAPSGHDRGPTVHRARGSADD